MTVITRRTLHYGALEHQTGDLHLPDCPVRAVVCLLHGGFWRMPYACQEMTPLADDLAGRGFAVWNIEYRRIGGGGGWPATFLDVSAAVDYLAEIADHGLDLPLGQLIVAGHSAGGHLALWSARRSGFPGINNVRVRVDAVAGLAPVADLAKAHSLAVGRNSVDEFLGGSPLSVEARYRVSSPRFLLPLRVRQLIIHGTEDDALPVSLSRAYVEAARQAGDSVAYVELEGAGHMDFLDTGTPAIACFRDWLTNLYGSA